MFGQNTHAYTGTQASMCHCLLYWGWGISYLAANCLMLARTSQILQCLESLFTPITHAVLLQLATKVVAAPVTLQLQITSFYFSSLHDREHSEPHKSISHSLAGGFSPSIGHLACESKS